MMKGTAMDGKTLEAAFDAFNHVSGVLTHSYRQLENKITLLNAQLEEMRYLRLQELHEKRTLANRMSAILESLPAAVVVVDRAGAILDYNNNAEKLLGGNLKGVTWKTITDQLLCGSRLSAGDIVLKDGRYININVSELDRHAQIILISDITYSKNISESFNQQQKFIAVGEVLAKLAHQIRTPLASSLLYLTSLQQSEAGETSKKAPLLGKLRICLKAIEATVNDLLGYVKGRAADRKSIVINDFMSNIRLAVQHDIEKNSAALVSTHQPEAFDIYGNLAALEGAIRNLIVNAIEASGFNAYVAMNIRLISEEVIITVTDNGPGIKQEEIAKIYDPFYTSKKNGTGLGLAVAKSVIEMHGGIITYRRREEGGSEFTVTIPQQQRYAVLSNYFRVA